MTPKGIKEWRPNTYYYLEYIDEKLTKHLYLHNRGLTKEVFSIDVNGNKKVAHFYYVAFMNGWKVNKEEWMHDRPRMEEFYGREPDVYISKRFTNKRTMIKAFPTLKYVYPDRYEDLHLFIRILKQHPEMELIYKNQDTNWLWSNLAFWRLSKVKQKQVVNFILKKDKKYKYIDNLNTILFALKHQNITSVKQYEAYQHKKYFMEHIPTNYKLDKKYVFSRYYNKEMDYYDIKLMMITYRDYLDMMKELKVRENLYPRDIEQAHDELVELKQFQEEQKEREGAKWRILTKKLYKKYSNCVPENKKYQLYIPQRQVDLMDLGKDMDNCVGSCSYGKDEKNGKCLIVAVYSNKKPIACCELNPKSQYKIEQIYAPGNEKLKSRAPRLFVNQFINKVKEMRI